MYHKYSKVHKQRVFYIIPNKHSTAVTAWTGLIWLRKGTSGSKHSEDSNKPSHSKNGRNS
jgi:hypothetical protein